jgi:hypothetical protein
VRDAGKDVQQLLQWEDRWPSRRAPRSWRPWPRRLLGPSQMMVSMLPWSGSALPL